MPRTGKGVGRYRERRGYIFYKDGPDTGPGVPMLRDQEDTNRDEWGKCLI